MEAAWPSGQHVGVLGSSSALINTWICFTVAPSSNPRPRLQIANWFAFGQLKFLTMLCSIRIKYLFQLFARPH